MAADSSIFTDMSNFFNEKLGKDHVSVSLTSMEEEQLVKKNIENFYKKLEELGFNLDELKDILDCRDSMLILSGAGSGKTTALILKIIRDLISGDLIKTQVINGVKISTQANILVSTFLKTGAEELEKSFNDWCRRLNLVGVNSNNIHFKTIHSEVYSALTSMGLKVDIKNDTSDLIRRIMGKYGIHSVLSNGRNVTIDEVADMNCLISYVRNRLDAQRYNHPLMDEYTIDTLQLEALLTNFKQHKMAQGIQDFEDLQEMLLEGLRCNPKVVEWIQRRYDFIYVDEFQDTSQLQYEILKFYFTGAKKVLAIGDDDQCIYSWRGSDIEIINKKFEEDFKPVVKQLTMNYRCSKNILNAVIPSIEKNTLRHPKKLRAAREGGIVDIIIDGSINHLMTGVKEDLSKGETVGVIARTNQDLLIPAILLELDENEINFGLSKSVSLDNRLPKTVFGLMDLVTKRYTPEFESMLKMFLPKYKHYEVEKLCDVLNINKEKSLFTIPLEDIRHSAPSLFNMIHTMRLNYEVSPKKAYLGLLKLLPQEVYGGKSIYAQRARDFVYYIQKIILEHDNVKDMTLEQLDELFNLILPQKLNRRKMTDNSRLFIKVTTVHEAKGKEWDNVYIWNDIDGCFPSSVGNRELTKDEFEEERRVHYIAWTRPKKKLTVYTRSDREGGFLQECDLSTCNIVEVRGINSKTKGVSDNRETQVFQKKEPQKVVKTFEEIVDDYYKKYMHFTWLAKSEGINLDTCDSKLGGKEKVIEELKKKSIHLYPADMIEFAITDALSELACITLR